METEMKFAGIDSSKVTNYIHSKTTQCHAIVTWMYSPSPVVKVHMLE